MDGARICLGSSRGFLGNTGTHELRSRLFPGYMDRELLWQASFFYKFPEVLFSYLKSNKIMFDEILKVIFIRDFSASSNTLIVMEFRKIASQKMLGDGTVYFYKNIFCIKNILKFFFLILLY